MSHAIHFSLDGATVEASSEETIWQIAARHGVDIPHLCYTPEPGYRADGNCRACMVEIEGERALAAACIRRPSEEMVVHTHSKRAKASRRMVFELLAADQPEREIAHEHDSHFWRQADDLAIAKSRFPRRETGVPRPDTSHAAMRVSLDA